MAEAAVGVWGTSFERLWSRGHLQDWIFEQGFAVEDAKLVASGVGERSTIVVVVAADERHFVTRVEVVVVHSIAAEEIFLRIYSVLVECGMQDFDEYSAQSAAVAQFLPKGEAARKSPGS